MKDVLTKLPATVSAQIVLHRTAKMPGIMSIPHNMKGQANRTMKAFCSKEQMPIIINKIINNGL
jgi:hypothetical protein